MACHLGKADGIGKGLTYQRMGCEMATIKVPEIQRTKVGSSVI